MGQMANGILYGVEAPELPTPAGWEEGDDSPAYDLILRWENAQGISWGTPGPKVRHEAEGGKELIGVWVACGGSGEDGAPYFMDEAMRLADVERVYAKAIARAAKLWKRFASWAKKEGVTLPEPTLWLTPCEVA